MRGSEKVVQDEARRRDHVSVFEEQGEQHGYIERDRKGSNRQGFSVRGRACIVFRC